MIGKPTDKAVAQYLFMILHRTANEMAETNYRKIYYAFKKVGREHEMKSYKKSFLQGFNDAIKERLKIQREEVSQENALVLRNAMIPVHDWVSKNLKLTYTSSSGRGSSNSYGKSHGYAAGQSVAMNRGVAGSSVKRLGS